MSLVCVQDIARWQAELATLHDTDSARRAELEKLVQSSEGKIQLCEKRLTAANKEVAQKQAVLEQIPGLSCE